MRVKVHPHLFSSKFLLITVVIIIVLIGLVSGILVLNSKSKISEEKYNKSQKELNDLKSVDQVKRNDELEKNIKNIEGTYSSVVTVYETIQDLRAQKQKTEEYEKELASILSLLSKRNYSSSSAQLGLLTKKIEADKAKNTLSLVPASSQTAVSNAPVNNVPPGSGYSIQKVKTEYGEFSVAIIAADLNSTRVIIDTASDDTCANNCPVLSLGDYVGRSGAFAGINGSYFCPESYPSCAGKTNSFDTLLMNKNKKYFNSDNNVYSNVPVAVFSVGSARFIGQSSGWGRDTGVDGVIANQPLLVSGGNVVYTGGGDPKLGSKGPRSFIGNKGSTVYIGVVFNATVAESAYTLKALGMENSLNLDSGGSTALWAGGYKVGPGRNIPNAVLFVRR